MQLIFFQEIRELIIWPKNHNSMDKTLSSVATELCCCCTEIPMEILENIFRTFIKISHRKVAISKMKEIVDETDELEDFANILALPSFPGGI